MVIWKLAKELGLTNKELLNMMAQHFGADPNLKASETVPVDPDKVRELIKDDLNIHSSVELAVIGSSQVESTDTEEYCTISSIVLESNMNKEDIQNYIDDQDIHISIINSEECVTITDRNDIIDHFKFENMTPTQYFEIVKGKLQEVTCDELKVVYDNALTLINAYMITGQKKACKKLAFQIHTIEKELEIIKLGFTKFVYKKDIEKYIESISKSVVKIIDLESYERDIPQDIIDNIVKTKDIFDEMYVIFTDYTGKAEKQIQKERREKDPILFGAFKTDGQMNDRFYFLGDWVDEYCDLTLDKMIAEYKDSEHTDMIRHISTPQDLEALKVQLGVIRKEDTKYMQFTNPGDDVDE